MADIPGGLDIRTDIEALIAKIDAAILAAQRKADDSSLLQAVRDDYTEAVTDYQKYKDYAVGFYSVE